MFIVKKNTRIITAILATVAFGIAAILGWTYLTQQTSAADMSKFDPGNIMSDAVMSNKDSMSVQQIQAFLNSKNACNNTNTYMASWYPHLQYTIRDGKFVCMAQDTFNGKSAAQIIWQVGQDYNINPQFLIVLLEKEQGLVTDTWPNHVQYRSATGFGCPDTAACDSKYFGLENQLANAANLFRTVLNGGWSNYPVGWTYVQYNPNASCGGKVINIQNRATSALYRYTPYQPNQSAIDAGYGLGDKCGAYGNRNTWALFTDWFGNTQGLGGFKGLDDPRWMQITKVTTKIDAYTGKKVGDEIRPGAQAKFIDKILINGEWIIRTQWDHERNNLHGFRENDISEIEFTAIPDTWMVVNTDTHKKDFIRDITNEKISYGSLAKFVDKATVNGETYYRTEYEQSIGRERGFKEKDLTEFTMVDFIKPRLMMLNVRSNKFDVLSDISAGSLDKGEIYFFNKLIRRGNQTLAQAKLDNGTNLVVDSAHLTEVDSNRLFYPFTDPRHMRINQNTTKFDVISGEAFGPLLASGTDAYFVDQIKIDGKWYARTQWDKENNNRHGVPVSQLSEIDPTLVQRQSIRMKNDSQKVDPVRLRTFEDLKKESTGIIIDRIVVQGVEYYRTEWEYSQSRHRYIRGSDIQF